jgi:hypothetical protein
MPRLANWRSGKRNEPRGLQGPEVTTDGDAVAERKSNMTIRTLAEAVSTLDAEVKLHAQPPSWEMAGKTVRAGWQPIVFKMDKQVVESPLVFEDELAQTLRPLLSKVSYAEAG